MDEIDNLNSITDPGGEELEDEFFGGSAGAPGAEADALARELRKKSDANKIQPLKKLAETGELRHLKFVLPISQYASDFIRKLARNTAVRIILRSLREAEQGTVIGPGQMKNYIDLLVRLDSKYHYLNKFRLEDPRITRVILDMLSQENREFTAQKLAEVITDSDERVRATAVKIIAEMLNQTETSLLVKLLRDPDARVRANVIEALETIGESNVIGILMRYKIDPNNRVRGTALKALWNLGYREIAGSLSDMLTDPNPKMRSSGIWVIGEIGHEQPKIKELLKIVEQDEDLLVRDNITRAREKIAWREKGLRVLVIDNDREFLRGLFRKMVRDGLHIIAAFDGESGVEAAVRQKPDLILLAMQIPRLNGLGVLEKLKSEITTRSIPVVAISEINLAGLLKKASEAGAKCHLIKPFEYGELREVIFRLA